MAAFTVSALSNAEMPVVILVLDSIETVKAVVFFFQLSGFINGSFNSSALVSEIDKQIKSSQIDDESAITEFIFSATSDG